MAMISIAALNLFLAEAPREAGDVGEGDLSVSSMISSGS